MAYSERACERIALSSSLSLGSAFAPSPRAARSWSRDRTTRFRLGCSKSRRRFVNCGASCTATREGRSSWMRVSSGTIRRGTAASQSGRPRNLDPSRRATACQAIRSAHAYDRCGARGRRLQPQDGVGRVVTKDPTRDANVGPSAFRPQEDSNGVNNAPSAWGQRCATPERPRARAADRPVTTRAAPS